MVAFTNRLNKANHLHSSNLDRRNENAWVMYQNRIFRHVYFSEINLNKEYKSLFSLREP